MEAKKTIVKQLFDHGFSAGEIFKQLKCLGINKVFIHKIIIWLLETNSFKDRARPGCSCLACTKEHIKRIHEKIQRNTQHSANKISTDENVNRRTVQVILNEDLGFRSYRKRKIQGLVQAQRI